MVQQILKEIQEVLPLNSTLKKVIMTWLATILQSSSSRTQSSSLTSFTAKRETQRTVSKIQTWLGISGVTVLKLYIRLPFYSQIEVLPMVSDIWMVLVHTLTNG